MEPIDFKYTTISLNDAYELSFKHALQVIERNGGTVDEENVTIKFQQPEPVPLKVAFEGHFPKQKKNLEQVLTNEISLEFEGIGFVITGGAQKKGKDDYTFDVEMSIDGEVIETVKLPTKFVHRRFYLFWRYQLADGKHEVRLKVLNPTDKAQVNLDDMLVYGANPVRALY